jgi:putative transposase
VPCAAGHGFVGIAWHASSMRTAYRCRAYPDTTQQAMLNRTFGCVRVVWNTILAARQERYATNRQGTSYGQASAALTAMKKDPQRAWLNEVSSVPLQQALRHQQQAFTAFFAQTARYPRFKSRAGRQAAEYTRSAFTLRDGQLRLAKTPGPLAFTWSWPGIDVAGLDATTVVVSKEPDGRWYVTLAVDAQPPQPLPAAGRAVGVDLGITSFAVTSHGERVANPRHLQRKARNLARYQRRLARKDLAVPGCSVHPRRGETALLARAAPLPAGEDNAQAWLTSGSASCTARARSLPGGGATRCRWVTLSRRLVIRSTSPARAA